MQFKIEELFTIKQACQEAIQHLENDFPETDNEEERDELVAIYSSQRHDYQMIIERIKSHLDLIKSPIDENIELP